MEDTIEQRIAERVVRALKADGGIAPRLMTLKQAAVYLGMTRNALRAKAAIGKVPTVSLDRNTRFDKLELDRLIEENRRGV